jgi:hypothetical protein
MWEYLFVRVEYRGDDLIVSEAWQGEEDTRFNGQYAHTAFQSLGAEGWELVGIDRANLLDGSWYVLKRHKNDGRIRDEPH